jgi:hypothetical protein
MQILSILLVLFLLYLLLIVFFLTWKFVVIGLAIYIAYRIIQKIIR